MRRWVDSGGKLEEGGFRSALLADLQETAGNRSSFDSWPG
jgi:hypothetical protein